MNYKPEVFVEGQWAQNALVFATRKEAEDNARALFMRWTMCSDSRAVETTEPVNYSYTDGELVAVNPISTAA